MGSSPSLSPWATLRFRRAKDVRGWALLGIPMPLYPRVMQRLFEQQARFIQRHEQGKFVSILFEAPTSLAARLALTFPAPDGHTVLSTNEAGDRILYGKFANSPRAQHQSEPTGPSVVELGQCDEFWQGVQALVDHEFGLEHDLSLDQWAAESRFIQEKSLLSSQDYCEGQPDDEAGPDEECWVEECLIDEVAEAGTAADDEPVASSWDEDGWEDDDVPMVCGEASEVLQKGDESADSFEDVWVASEAEPLEFSPLPAAIERSESGESHENNGDGEQENWSPTTNTAGADDFPANDPALGAANSDIEESRVSSKTCSSVEPDSRSEPDSGVESGETPVMAAEPTSVRLEPFPAVATSEGLSPANPPSVPHTVTPTAVGKVLGRMTIEQALAHRNSRPDLPSAPMPWRDEPSLPQGSPSPEHWPPHSLPRILKPEAPHDDWAVGRESVLQGDRFQIELLLHHGVEAWNRWRSQNPNLRPNLRGAYLNHLDLRWADLHDADLRFAFFFYSDLTEADLCGASLFGADLIHANLEAADLRFASLQGAYLSRANLNYADLREADLRGAFLYGAEFYGAALPQGWLLGDRFPSPAVPDAAD